jgi:hypothetical protein
MNKKLKPKKSDAVFTPDELKLATTGASVVSHKIVELRSKCFEQFEEILLDMAKNVEASFEIASIEGYIRLADIERRVDLANYHLNSEQKDEADGGTVTFELALNRLTKLAMGNFYSKYFGKSSDLDFDTDNRREIVTEIQSCIAALVLGGNIQLAFNLMYLAGAFQFIRENFNKSDLFKKGSQKKFNQRLNELKVWVYLYNVTNRGLIPTKKNINFEIFKMETAEFGKILKRMGLSDIIPEESSSPNNPESGSLFCGTKRTGIDCNKKEKIIRPVDESLRRKIRLFSKICG